MDPLDEVDGGVDPTKHAGSPLDNIDGKRKRVAKQAAKGV
jgi:hypothetical protein